MDYTEVDRIINYYDLEEEDAFEKMVVDIKPIPEMNGCPLGLYYPDSATVVIPPDGLESVLLHELGHRFGHYHYNDLSETFAEDYRRHYQKGTALMYDGQDFARLPKFDALFQEGERGMLALAFNVGLSQEDISGIKEEFVRYSQGEAIPHVSYSEEGIPTLTVNFQKGVAWLVIVGAVMSATVVLSAAALGYAVYKTTKDFPWLPVVIGAGVLSVLGLRALSQHTSSISQKVSEIRRG